VFLGELRLVAQVAILARSGPEMLRPLRGAGISDLDLVNENCMGMEVGDMHVHESYAVVMARIDGHIVSGVGRLECSRRRAVRRIV
jgi:hypothetical protein